MEVVMRDLDLFRMIKVMHDVERLKTILFNLE